MRRGWYWAGQVWMAPMTVFGLLQTLAGARFHSVTREGVLQFVVRDRGLLCWWMRTFGVSAYTLGAVVTYVAPEGPTDPRLYRHELQHVMQTMVCGPLMPVTYFGSSLWQVLRGRRIYADNWFEVNARAAEATAIPALVSARDRSR